MFVSLALTVQELNSGECGSLILICFHFDSFKFSHLERVLCECDVDLHPLQCWEDLFSHQLARCCRKIFEYHFPWFGIKG